MSRVDDPQRPGFTIRCRNRAGVDIRGRNGKSAGNLRTADGQPLLDPVIAIDPN